MSKNSSDATTMDETIQDSQSISFRDIIENKSLVEALEKNSLINPTPVQIKTIPTALSGTDLIAQAQTGSGKTLAFSIPVVASLQNSDKHIDKTLALILTPTRELAEQIHLVINSISPDLAPVCVIGGVDQKKQIKKLSSDARVVIGTPGRIMDLMRQKELSLRHCKTFVLDEADEMLSMGFVDDIKDILKKLPKSRQGLFLSATITPRVEMLARSFLSSPEKIIIETDDDLVPDIEHSYYEVGSDLMAKPAALTDIIEVLQPDSTIIFCNTKSDTELVEALLRRKGFDARRINSDLNQSQRNRVMTKIRAKELKFLVATDIAARGIDIAEIELVVNFSIHDQPETYVHRTGRTGRAGKKGSAISLVGPKDFGSFHFLSKVLDTDFTKKELPSDSDVASARLKHVQEIISSKEVVPKERDQLVAKELLSNLGVKASENEDLVKQIALMSRCIIETYTSKECESLEDELAKENISSEDKSSKREKRSKRKDSEGRENDKESPGRKPKGPEMRLYIGRGSKDGLDLNSLLKLIKEHAGLEKNKVKNITLRENYGFLDAFEAEAKLIVEKLSSIEFDNSPLPIEVATTISSSKPARRNSSRNRSDRSSRGRSRSKGSDNRKKSSGRR